MNAAERSVLIVGGTSDIGRAVAHVYAEAGWRIWLAARDRAGAERNAADIAARFGAQAEVFELDVLDTGRFDGFIAGLPALPRTVVCLVGDLGEQPRAQADPGYAARVLRSNFEGPALLLGAFAERFEQRGSGLLLGVSSVAGDRGRASNYIYGSAKAGFTAFLSGLRNRLAPSGVRVVTVKPGFVRTRMTAGMKLPGPLTAEPAAVARRVFAAENGGGDVVYVRPVWRPIMGVIRLLPEPLFKRLSL